MNLNDINDQLAWGVLVLAVAVLLLAVAPMLRDPKVGRALMFAAAGLAVVGLVLGIVRVVD